ncbi:MAG: MBL fold metallo-hydrolase RNA specificity domain-containing protein [Nanoarchaeota archaeon]
MIELIPIGGYKEIGRNCIAVKIDDEVVILDLGLQLDRYIAYTEDEDNINVSAKSLIEIGAVPDVNHISDLRSKVVGICISHAHLDHVGAVPFLASKFDCPIYATPFTIEVINALTADKDVALPNELVRKDINSRFRISEHIEGEFISMTHSVPETVVIVLHTPYGQVVYANDFKFDNAPTLGSKPNYARLRQLKPHVLIMDSLYALNFAKTPSETIAREMLRDVVYGVETKGKAIIITTFSSHIARLKSILEIGEHLNRKVVFVGRSLERYVTAAEAVGIASFTDKVEIIKYRSQIQRYFKRLKDPQNHVFVVTGHQGEPKAALARLADGMFPFGEEDIVVFSCNVIPVLGNIENRHKLEAALVAKKCRLFKDIHVSGHGSREDQRDMINLLKPTYFVPTHGELRMLESVKELALQMGYDESKVLILDNGQRVRV